MTLNFHTAWKENLKNNRKRLFWVVPMILMGGLLLHGENNLGFLFLAIGIHYLINFYDYYSFYKKSKKDFFKLVEKEKNGQIAANENSVWEFTDDYFSYKDYKYEAKIKWKAFKSFRVIDKNLFLDLGLGNDSSFVIGEIEIGTENFNRLLEFLKVKIG
jgi:hypothetical protein